MYMANKEVGIYSEVGKRKRGTCTYRHLQEMQRNQETATKRKT